MGRQIQLVATNADEQQFLAFLHETADITVFESFAPHVRQLRVEQFNPMRPGHWQYFIWNRSFQWRPTYGTVGPQAYHADMIGWRYISNIHAAPVIKFHRSGAGSGRVYWAKDFAAPNGLDYDVGAFSKWFDVVTRWIRKNGRKLEKGALEPYFLPEAYEEAQIARKA
jgi:hypothetical protein